MQSNLSLIDSHFHEPECSFESINAGCSATDLPERIEKYSNDKTIFAAAMGPWETENRSQQEVDSQFEILKENISKYNPVFIGEIGLDYYWKYGTVELQKNLFIRQIELAEELKKRVLIHSRESASDTCEIIKKYGPSNGGVIHCCDGNLNLIETALSKGYYISFAGNITYKSNRHLRDALKTVPLDRLLLETDSPFLSPVPLRGKPNCSDYIIYTYEEAAKVLDMQVENLAKVIYSNFRAFVTVRTH